MDGHWKGLIAVVAVLLIVLVSALPSVEHEEGAPRTQLSREELNLTALELEGKRVYEKYCIGCHGVRGDGNGVSARWLEIAPRDFVASGGIIRFAEVNLGTVPRIEDLKRAIRHGLIGSAMPAWSELPDPEITAVAHYIRTFASRRLNYNVILQTPPPEQQPTASEVLAKLLGQTRDTALALFKGRGSTQPPFVLPIQGVGLKRAEAVVEELKDSKLQAHVAPSEEEGRLAVLFDDPFLSKDPAKYERNIAEAIRQGRKIYHGVAKCVECHPSYHRTPDEWVYLTYVKDPAVGGSMRDNPHQSLGIHTDEYTGKPLMPPDFTRGPIKAGGDPTSLARTIGVGVGGARMPAWADTFRKSLKMYERFDGTVTELAEEIDPDYASYTPEDEEYWYFVDDISAEMQKRGAKKFWALVYYIHALIPEQYGGGAEKWGHYANPPIDNYKSPERWEN